MSSPPAADVRHVRRLALKLLAFLLFSGGLWAGILAFVLVAVWPGAGAFSDTGRGAQLWLDRDLLLILIMVGAALGLLGVATVVALRRHRAPLPSAGAPPRAARLGQQSRLRSNVIVIGGFLFLIAVILFRRLG